MLTRVRTPVCVSIRSLNVVLSRHWKSYSLARDRGEAAVTGLMHVSDLGISPPDIGRPVRDDVTVAPRSSPLEWARRRRTYREEAKVVAARERAKGRLHRLGEGWYVFDAPALGVDAPD